MPDHALLSASSSARWVKCPPSARLCEEIPDTNTTYAQEGTDCHALCAYLVEKELGRDVQDPTGNLTYYNAEMQGYAEEYRNFVMEKLEETKLHCSDPLVMIEQCLDYSKWVEGGFGTGDCVIVADDILMIIDFKYGMGVLVSAGDDENGGNTQMMCYALGALDIFKDLYDITDIEMTIFQPRRQNISTYTMTKEALLKWADEVLSPAAKLAYKGEGEFKAGEHCQFCKVKATCRARARYNLQLAKYDFEKPETLSPAEIAAILPQIDQLISWGNDVKDYALDAAQRGTHFDGYKLVEGRSTRKFTDEKLVAATVQDAGYDPYEKKLLGITAMSKMLGREKFNELLGAYIYKPQGKPALVPEKDARPALNLAQDDFKENMEEN